MNVFVKKNLISLFVLFVSVTALAQQQAVIHIENRYNKEINIDIFSAYGVDIPLYPLHIKSGQTTTKQYPIEYTPDDNHVMVLEVNDYPNICLFDHTYLIHAYYDSSSGNKVIRPKFELLSANGTESGGDYCGSTLPQPVISFDGKTGTIIVQ